MRNSSIFLSIVFLLGSFNLCAGTKLSKAVISEDLANVKACLKDGEKINEFDKWGWTPLMWAVYGRALPITEHLLANGADPNIRAEKSYGGLKKGATALVVAGYYGLDDQALALIGKGGKPEIADDSGKTGLDYAREYGFSDAILVLSGKVKADPRTGEYDREVNTTPLLKTYTRVVVEDFTTLNEIAKEYEYAVSDCQIKALGTLMGKKVFEKVEVKAADTNIGDSTLVLRVELTELRIKNAAAQTNFWAKLATGNSYIHAKVKLVDGATGKVEREQLLSTENNAWGAAFTNGTTDRSIPGDMGTMIAGYVITVAGRRPGPAGK